MASQIIMIIIVFKSEIALKNYSLKCTISIQNDHKFTMVMTRAQCILKPSEFQAFKLPSYTSIFLTILLFVDATLLFLV